MWLGLSAKSKRNPDQAGPVPFLCRGLGDPLHVTACRLLQLQAAGGLQIGPDTYAQLSRMIYSFKPLGRALQTKTRRQADEQTQNSVQLGLAFLLFNIMLAPLAHMSI